MRVGEDVIDSAAALDDTVRLASRAEMLGVLHSAAAHDFRDSLNSISINVELLARTLDGQMRPEDAAVQQRCLTSLRRELKNLARTTGAALETTQLEPAEAGRVGLESIVMSIVALIRRRADRQRVTVTYTPPTQSMEVVGDADALRHAVFNLAINALEAMGQGGEVMFALDRDGSDAVLTISDTGAGIPAEMLAKVWDLFFTTKPGGLGLGLHVVKNVAAVHRGSVTLDRRETGVTFGLRLPLIS